VSTGLLGEDAPTPSGCGPDVDDVAVVSSRRRGGKSFAFALRQRRKCGGVLRRGLMYDGSYTWSRVWR